MLAAYWNVLLRTSCPSHHLQWWSCLALGLFQEHELKRLLHLCEAGTSLGHLWDIWHLGHLFPAVGEPRAPPGTGTTGAPGLSAIVAEGSPWPGRRDTSYDTPKRTRTRWTRWTRTYKKYWGNIPEITRTNHSSEILKWTNFADWIPGSSHIFTPLSFG